jgi:hypothetical protein
MAIESEMRSELNSIPPLSAADIALFVPAVVAGLVVIGVGLTLRFLLGNDRVARMIDGVLGD